MLRMFDNAKEASLEIVYLVLTILLRRRSLKTNLNPRRSESTLEQVKCGSRFGFVACSMVHW